MFELKFLPGGRGLKNLGTDKTELLNLNSSTSCGTFVTTKFIQNELATPFHYLLDLSLLGIGVGFDTLGS